MDPSPGSPRGMQANRRHREEWSTPNRNSRNAPPHTAGHISRVCPVSYHHQRKITMKLLITTLILAASCPAQTVAYGHNDKYLLPDRSVTPGAVNPAIVGDL